MNTIYKEGKEELRARLRRVLTGCGVDPDILDYKQLQSADRLITVCEARLAQIHEHEESIASLKPTKSSIAQEAGLKRTTISESHNIALLKIYDTFFPKKIEESVPVTEYEALKSRNAELQRMVDAHAITQTRLMTAIEDKKKLESKSHMQAESIKNLTRIINDLKQRHLEETGEELDINLSRIFKESEEEERSGRVIPISIVPPSGIKS
jgi:hypothetical protein